MSRSADRWPLATIVVPRFDGYGQHVSDTTPEMQAIQIEIYRKMAPEARLAAAFELSAMSRRLLSEGVRRRHPAYSEEEVRVATIRLWLGDDDFRRAYPDAPMVEP